MSEVTMEKLVADFKLLIDDAEQLVRASVDQAGERITELRQRLTRSIEEGREALRRCEQEVREQADKAKSRARSVLQQETWCRLACAACLGVLIGLFLRCSRSKPQEPRQ